MAGTQERAVIRRPAAGVTISPGQLTRMRDLRALSREELAEQTGEVLFDYDRFAAMIAGRGSVSAQAARALWMALDARPGEILGGLPEGLPDQQVPRWIRANGGWFLNVAAVSALRERKGWTEGALAAATARHWFSRDSVAKMERGERRPKPRTLRAFCQVLACAPADLMPGGRPLPDGATKTRADLTEYNAGMRAFADAQDPPISYRNNSGRIVYRRELRDRYAEYLAGQGIALAS